MNAMPSPIEPEFPTDLPVRGHPDSGMNPDLGEDPFADDHRQPLRAVKRRSSRLALLVMFCIGVGATVAWYSFGDTARAALAGMSPQLAWMAPQPPVAAPPPVPATPPGPSLGEQLSAASQDIDAVRQNVDRIATAQGQIIHSISQLSTGQEQLTKEIEKLQAVEQYILYKDSEPPATRAAPVSRRASVPLPLTPPRAR